MCITEDRIMSEPACDCLILVTEVRSGHSEYKCDRSQGTTCYGRLESWCPLRYTEPEYTPKLGKDGKPRLF